MCCASANSKMAKELVGTNYGCFFCNIMNREQLAEERNVLEDWRKKLKTIHKQQKQQREQISREGQRLIQERNTIRILKSHVATNIGSIYEYSRKEN